MCSRLRKGLWGQKPCLLQCFRAFGKGEGAKSLVFSIVVSPSERAKRPKNLHLKVFPRLGKGRRGKNHCISQGFCSFGEGEGARHLTFYNIFAPSEWAKGPTTLYCTIILRLRRRRKGQTPCIFNCFRAFGKGEGAKHVAFYNVFAPSEWAKGAKHLVFSIVFVFPSERAKGPQTLYFIVFSCLRKG